MKIIPALLFISIISADQLIKFFVSGLKNTQGIFIFPEILKLKIYQNTGVAFGIPLNPWIAYFLIIIFGILILIIWQRKSIVCRSHLAFYFYAFILIFSGALSNLLDRIRFGYVIDFIEFIPLKGFFNLADCAIMIGTGIIVWKMLNRKKIKQI